MKIFNSFPVQVILLTLVLLAFCFFKAASFNPADFGYKTRIAVGVFWVLCVGVLYLIHIIRDFFKTLGI